MARKYGKKASEKVGRTMREFKRGKLKTRAGRKVTSREQAIAIGIAQARRAGYKVPPPTGHATKRAVRRKLPAIARGKVMRRIVTDDKRFVISQIDPSTYWILDLDWYNEGTAKDLEGAYKIVASMRAKHP